MSPSDTMSNRRLHPAAVARLRATLHGIEVGPAARAALAPVLTCGPRSSGPPVAHETAAPIDALHKHHLAMIKILLRADDALFRYLARAILGTPRNAEVLPTACPADPTLIEFALPFALPGAPQVHGGIVLSCFRVRDWHGREPGSPFDTTLLVPTASGPRKFSLPLWMGLDLIGLAGLGNPTDPSRKKALAAIDRITANDSGSSGTTDPFHGWSARRDVL